MKHTPGEWRVSKAGTFITTHGMSAICRMNYGGKWEWATKKGSFEDLANAYRIVDCVNGCASITNPLAVGKLLEACQAMVEAYGCECLDEGPKHHCPMCQAKQAIAEAIEGV